MIRLALCALLLLLFGCKTTPESHRTFGDAQIEDIPVPRNATYRNENQRSYSYRSKNFRCGQLHYRFNGPVEEAARFFRNTMVRAPYNWKLDADDSVASGSTRLVFTKDDERCTIDVDHVPGTSKDDLAVSILVRLNYKYH